MNGKTYRVHLTGEEEKHLKDTVNKGVHPARQVRRAQILLLLNEREDREGKPLKTPQQSGIAECCQCHIDLVYTAGKQYVQEGLERVLNRKKRETPPVPAKVTGEVEAKMQAAASRLPGTAGGHYG
jgi:hypothetical protein